MTMLDCIIFMPKRITDRQCIGAPWLGKCGRVGNGVAEDTEQGTLLKAESDQTTPSGVMHLTQRSKATMCARKVRGDGRHLGALDGQNLVFRPPHVTCDRLCCRAAVSRDLVPHQIDRL